MKRLDESPGPSPVSDEGADSRIEKLEALVVRIAHAHCEGSGPDGNAFGFWTSDYPESPGAFGATENEAAINFLEELYPE